MPFSRSELEAYISEHALAQESADYIRCAAAGLARDVGTNSFVCVKTEYQSRKMGFSINTESRTGELAYAIHLDFDADVIAFFEQPPEVDCYRHLKSGARRVTTYVPDILVLHRSGPFVAQIKPKESLDKLVARSEDWVCEGSGYRDLAAEEGLSRFRLPHKVVCSADLDRQRTTNIALLIQSLDEPRMDDATTHSCLAYLRKEGVCSLSAVAKHLAITDFTPLLSLLARRILFTDLSRFSLVHPEACFVSDNPSLLRDEVYEAWHHLSRDPGRDLSSQADRRELPSARYLSKGIAKLEKLEEGRNGRSRRRWKKKIQEAQAMGISPLVALTPNHHLSGNRNPKRPLVVLGFAEHVIRTHWPTEMRPTPSALARIYRAEAEEFHPDFRPLSNPTFRKVFDGVRDELSRARGGNRAANATEAPTDVADRALQAGRPFELASCDHYLIDLYCEVMDANGLSYAVLPWLTVLRDCYTKSVLAFCVSLKAPSRRSCARIMRQCVRLHGRLPETIVVDNGSDFSSVYFSALLAHCRVNLMRRPSGHPRYGSEAERFFGQFKDLWLSMRPGNKVSVKEVRSVSGSHRPEKHACLSLLDLWEDLLAFNAWFDQYATDSSLASPGVLTLRGLAQFGCSGRKCAYDDVFVIASAVDDGNYTLDPQRGLHIGAFHYWDPRLAQLRGHASVEVRIDPEDPYRVYALIGSTWVACLASRAPTYLTQTSLAQAVEGVVMLDGAKMREIVKEDADRNLVHAVRDRQKSQDEPCCAPPATGHMDDAVAPADFFSEVASRSLEKLETPLW